MRFLSRPFTNLVKTGLILGMNIVQSHIDANLPIPPPVTRWEDLLVRVGAQRDRDAFIRLFEHFAPRLKSFLMKGGVDPASAEELAQETMLAVWDKADRYNPEKAAASTWIFTIARNRRSDLLRRVMRAEPEADDLDLPVPPRQDAQLARHEEARAVADAIAHLPPEQAELIQKAFFEEKTHKDIADETALPLGTVKSRIRLALTRLRGLLGPENDGWEQDDT